MGSVVCSPSPGAEGGRAGSRNAIWGSLVPESTCASRNTGQVTVLSWRPVKATLSRGERTASYELHRNIYEKILEALGKRGALNCKVQTILCKETAKVTVVYLRRH